ncbi:transposable element Tc1 transposase [Trichonephila clavipes]|nr:transposable element Tc1 transposase [Trichonephila clavipes]
MDPFLIGVLVKGKSHDLTSLGLSRRYTSGASVGRTALEGQQVADLQVVFLGQRCSPINASGIRTSFHSKLLSGPADSPLTEHVWDLLGQHIARGKSPTASKDGLRVRVQTIWVSLLQADIQHLFDFMPRLMAALIAARGGYTKY